MFFSIKRYLFMLATLALPAMSKAVAPSLGQLTTTPDCQQWVDSVYNSLTSRQRIAQLFCPVVDPTKGEAATVLIKRYTATDMGIGGLLLRGGSLQEYVTMINLVQSNSRVPVLVTLDGEWGLAMRVPGTPKFPYNMALGAITDTRLLEEYGNEVARECHEMGIQVDFAPVADVNVNPANPVIGRRSFGEDPERVAAAVVAYSRGMEHNRVITTAKHFPGHGDTSTDSHKTLPVVDHTVAEMESCDLLPFQRYINAGMSGIMVGHLSVPSLDASGTAASMSYPIVTELLQNKMGFKGLIFTDALEMKGANNTGLNNCVAAFKAGADMLLSSPNPPSDIQAMEKAIADGTISNDEVERRCRKILAYKWAVGLQNKPAKIDINGIKNRLDTHDAKGLIERLTAATVTVTGNSDDLLPLKPSTKVALLNFGAPDNNSMATIMKHHARVDIIPGGEGAAISTETLKKIKEYDVVVVGVFNDNTTTVSKVESLTDIKGLVPVMFMTPYKAMKFGKLLANAAAIVMMYDDNEFARKAAADAIFAGNPVSGRLPVSMPGIAALGEGVSYPASRLSFSMPHTVGVNDWLVDSIDDIVRPALRQGAFPGMQVVVVKNGKVVADKSYGKLSNQPSSPAVTPQSLFDLASVSKVTGTLPGIMLLRDRGLLNLDTSLSTYIPELENTDKSTLTPRQLLFHESGMPASLDMYSIMMDPGTYSGALTRSRLRTPHTIRISRNVYGHNCAKLRRDITSPVATDEMNIEIAKGVWGGQATMDTLMHRIYNIQLKSKSMRYSCLNFCLLMDIEQRLTGQKHERFVSENVFDRIGAYTMCYRPLQRFTTDEIAATENDTYLRRQTLRGYVHDELAAFSGGVQGNAGLFSSATDVAKLCMLYLNNGIYGGIRVLSEAAVKEFTSTQSPTCRRGLGFDRPDIIAPDKSPCPEEVPASAYGHTGFTGTCFWVDPDNSLIYVFLSNRVNPSRDNTAWNRNKVRSRIHSLIYRALISADNQK